MSEAIVNICAGYGDSGKGLMTDYYASKHLDAINIRFNGGAQASHTVVTPNGERHAFSHFGAGSFQGLPTFLSNHFVVNPLLFVKEYKILEQKFGIKPKIYIDSQCMVTTPFDMLLNQKMESMRGNDPHGSCGVGFGETIQRCLDHTAICMGDIANANIEDNVFVWNDTIRKDYVPTRIDLLTASSTFTDILYNDELIIHYIEAIQFMLSCVEVIDFLSFSSKQLKDRTLIFEGAQGLLLDMDYGFFPHVTRSNCGMKNVSNILDRISGKHDVTVNYITRSYTTRHGAGPLYLEDNTIPDRHNIIDETNIHNDWQGSLRFAPLNVDLFNSITAKDFANYAPKGAKRVNTMTCIDQLVRKVQVIRDGKVDNLYKGAFQVFADRNFEIQSFGPTRNDVIDNT